MLGWLPELLSRLALSFTQSFLPNGRRRQHEPFGISVLSCAAGKTTEQNLTFVTFEDQGEQSHGELSFLTNLPEGSLDRLESLTEGYDSESICDPRFAVLL